MPRFRAACLSFLLVAAMVIAGCHPAVRIMERYEKTDPEDPVELIPYTVNLYALDLLRNDQDLFLVREYMSWYLNHLNYPDHLDMTGTMYDYAVFSQWEEQSLTRYDSVDSYSATFLMVVWEYFKKTNDTEFIDRNRKALEDIAYTIPFLQDKDGLTWALPGYLVKYLMDNCEAYGGMTAFAELARARGWAVADYYEAIREDIEQGIVKQLYDPRLARFDWALDEERKHSKSKWETFYPDAYAQIFPVLYKVPANDPEIRKHLWEEFNRHHGQSVATAPIEQQVVYRLTMANRP